MRRLGPCLIAVLAACLLLSAAPARAAGSPERIGAFAGAMRWCQERLPGPDARYRRARLRAAQELGGMNRRERARAVAGRDRAFENGRFLGERLDRRSCDRLVRASEWSRYAGD